MFASLNKSIGHNVQKFNVIISRIFTYASLQKINLKFSDLPKRMPNLGKVNLEMILCDIFFQMYSNLIGCNDY